MLLQAAYHYPTTENLKQLIEYLRSLGGKPLKLACIRNNIFKSSWSEKDSNTVNRCHLQAAALCIEHFVVKDAIEANRETIQTALADLVGYLKQLDVTIDKPPVLSSPNVQISPVHYSHAQKLFYESKLPEEKNPRYHYDLLVLYATRLSVDKRILGFLGIDFIETNGPPFGLSRFFPILKKTINIDFAPDINWDEIELVYSWLNHHMHRLFRPEPWVIHQSFEILNPLFTPGKKDIDDQTIMSLFASTYVEDEEALKGEISSHIFAVFPKARIYWKHKREILKKNIP